MSGTAGGMRHASLSFLLSLAVAFAGCLGEEAPADGRNADNGTPTPDTQDPTQPSPTTDDSERVVIEGFAFMPQRLEVAPGVSVEWRNEDAAPHTATSEDGVFESGTLTQGDEFRFTFTEPGEYPYFCSFHPNMTATIVVTGDAASPPPDDDGGDEGGDGTSGDGEPTDTGGNATADSVAIDIEGFAYAPESSTVTVGSTVTWTNLDDAPHSATARDESFDTGVFGQGESRAVTLDTVGTFEYYCIVHPSMVATITVEAA